MDLVLLVIGLAILAFLAMKGMPVLFASLVCGVFVLATAGVDILDGLTSADGSYMLSFSTFVRNYYLMFIFGAMFGKLCEISGATETIARTIVGKFGSKYVCVGLVIAAGVMVFGGINVYVAVFALYPLGMSLFREADIPRRFFPPVCMAGTATWAMTAPFTPSTQNIIPMSYLGTSLSSGVKCGTVGTIFTVVVSLIYIQARVKKLKKDGEHFEPLESEKDVQTRESSQLPGFVRSLVPLIILIVILNIKINGEGIPIIFSLFLGIVIACIVYWKYLPHSWSGFWVHMTTGANNGITSLINTAATVGFGGCIAVTPAFSRLADLVTETAQANPDASYWMCAIAVTCLAGVAGSASGGLAFAIPICADVFLPLGLSPAGIHRVAVVSSSALDSLPHNGYVNTLLNVSHCTHKSSYADLFMLSVVVTIFELIIVTALATVGFI